MTQERRRKTHLVWTCSSLAPPQLKKAVGHERRGKTPPPTTEEEEETSVPEGKSRSVTDSVDSDSSEHSDEDVDDGSGEWQQGEQGWQVYDGTSSDTPVAEEGPSEASVVEEAAPTEAPPLPEGGLPPGWTMDQWKWYGHEWLEKNGGK